MFPIRRHIFFHKHKFKKSGRTHHSMVKSSPTKLSWKKCLNPSRHQPLLLPDVCGISLIRPHFEREQRPNVFVDLVFQTRWCNSPLFRDSLSSKSHNPQNPQIKPHKKIRFACSFRQKSEEQEWKISVMDTPGWSDSPKCDLPTLFLLFGLTWDLIFFGGSWTLHFLCVCSFLQVEDLGKIPITRMNLLVAWSWVDQNHLIFGGVNNCYASQCVWRVWYWKKSVVVYTLETKI